MPDDLRAIRLQKLDAIRASGVNPYPERYERTHTLADAKALPLDTDGVKLAGRIVMMRDMGKLTFAHLHDFSGRLQIALQQDDIGKERYKEFLKQLDIGDFLGVTGKMFKTHKGEISLLISDFVILGKSLRPLPEKWHGIQDQETIYRQRYLDLVMNPDSLARFKTRTAIVKKIRDYLDVHGFSEVDTPILATKASGALAKPFLTHHNALDLDVFLRIAPETYLKRLIVGGYDKVYEMARCFRNEGMDPSHLQEFTMLEYYVAYWNYEDNMTFTEQLLSAVVEEVTGSTVITYQDQKIDFKAPWPRRKLRDIIFEDCGIDIYTISSVEELKKQITEKKITLEYDEGIGLPNLIDTLYKKVSRPKLIQPTFVIYHPLDLKPLARKNDTDPTIADSFQLLVNGWEIVNAYSELVDPIDQRARFTVQSDAKAAGDKETMEGEEDYLDAMEYGMPPISGWGMGIDRFVALLTNQENLKDVVLFPLLRPLQ